ncbi:MAG TPA: hypothetical protein VEZ70_14025 [Allosphingosinicella sp.]|nr:hypothetical protein [Allosphingosinicella sp.]
MRLISILCLAAAGFALAGAKPAPPRELAKPAAPRELVLTASQGPYVDAVINGVPLRLKLEFALLPDITLNPDAAERAGLGRGDSAWTLQIGPVKLPGRRATLPVTLAGLPTQTMVRWLERPVTDGADGLISPAALPFDSVTLERGPGSPSDREIALEARVHDTHGLFVPVDIGGRRVAARLSFLFPRTTAPAAAVAVIAKRHGGALEDVKSMTEIGHGVFRPVRRFRLAEPLRIGELTIESLLARTSDFRGDHKLILPRATAAPGEILVTGKNKSQFALYRITVGLDVLERCSAATFDRPLAQIRLRCAAP